MTYIALRSTAFELLELMDVLSGRIETVAACTLEVVMDKGVVVVVSWSKIENTKSKSDERIKKRGYFSK